MFNYKSKNLNFLSKFGTRFSKSWVCKVPYLEVTDNMKNMSYISTGYSHPLIRSVDKFECSGLEVVSGSYTMCYSGVAVALRNDMVKHVAKMESFSITVVRFIFS